MKKAIFLSELDDKLASVFPSYVIDEIEKEVSLDKRFYKKSDILENPSAFFDVAFIFSTWGMPSFTEEEIESAFPSLEAIFYAAGTVQGFARPFLCRGIKVFSAWAANAVPVAEYTVAEIILSGKSFYTQTRLMKAKRADAAYALRDACIGNYGEKVGLIGCGMIGSLVAKALRAYDLEVLAFDPFLSPERAAMLGVKMASLEEIFASCRVISNHLANNEQTKGMLGYEHFSKMLPYSTFINTGRGAQVRENDLIRVLGEREDITALLDVTACEPPRDDSPLYTLENCILTPHIAGSLGGEVVRMARYMTEECRLYLDDKKTRYEVTLDMLSTMA